MRDIKRVFDPENLMNPGKVVPALSAEKRLKQLGIDLGTVSAPVANYVNAVRTGNLLYLAGKGPRPVRRQAPAGQGRARVHRRAGLPARARRSASTCWR